MFHFIDEKRRTGLPAVSETTPRGEAGYTLFALLAMMTVLAIALTAVAPSMRQQAQRERELEAIRRGEEIADAILVYRDRTNKFPTSMKELEEGVPAGTKKLYLLRHSAMRDPLTEDGEWRMVRDTPTSSAFCNFVGALTTYNDGNPPAATISAPPTPFASVDYTPQLAKCAASVLRNSGGLPLPDNNNDDDDSGGGVDGGGPIIGVASRSREASVVNYFGIEQHNKWVFTPAVPSRMAIVPQS